MNDGDVLGWVFFSFQFLINKNTFSYNLSRATCDTIVTRCDVVLVTRLFTLNPQRNCCDTIFYINLAVV